MASLFRHSGEGTSLKGGGTTVGTDHESETARAGALDRFGTERNVLLTTFRRDGTPVGTPVHIAVVGSVAYIRTFEPSGKLKRMRRNNHVEIAPCTVRGRVTGAPLRATARILDGKDAVAAARALAAKYPVLHGRLIPWYHRRKGLVTTQVPTMGERGAGCDPSATTGGPALATWTTTAVRHEDEPLPSP
jgi:PPOX class probable F420-dependent enzyme, Rv2061 family